MDDADIPMTSSPLQRFFEEKEEGYSRWEDKPTNCSYDDLDEDLLIETIITANENGRLNYVYRNVKEALTKLDLLDSDGNIKTVGYYLFGKNKPLTIKEANYPNDVRTEFGELKECKGNILNASKKRFLISKTTFLINRKLLMLKDLKNRKYL